MTKQDRLREIKEAHMWVVSKAIATDMDWLMQEVELAWRVNAVARKSLETCKHFMTDGCCPEDVVGEIEEALTQMDALEKGMK